MLFMDGQVHQNRDEYMKFVGEQFGPSQWVVVRLWRGSKTQQMGILHKEDPRGRGTNSNRQSRLSFTPTEYKSTHSSRFLVEWRCTVTRQLQRNTYVLHTASGTPCMVHWQTTFVFSRLDVFQSKSLNSEDSHSRHWRGFELDMQKEMSSNWCYSNLAIKCVLVFVSFIEYNPYFNLLQRQSVSRPFSRRTQESW